MVRRELCSSKGYVEDIHTDGVGPVGHHIQHVTVQFLFSVRASGCRSSGHGFCSRCAGVVRRRRSWWSVGRLVLVSLLQES